MKRRNAEERNRTIHALLMPWVLAALTAFSLAACGGGGGGAPAATTAAPKETSAETKAEAPAAETTVAEAVKAAGETKAAAAAAAEVKAPAAAETSAAEPETEAETMEAAAEFPVEGEYRMFGAQNEGLTVSSEEMGMESILILTEDGKGSMTMDEDQMDITSWTSEDGKITITMADGGSADGTIGGGIIALDVMGTGDVIMLYAVEGADTSGYEVLTKEELLEKMAAGEGQADTGSKVSALFHSLDPDAGLHLSYQLHTEYLDAVQDMEVYSKDGVYYSSADTKVQGADETVVTFFKDGKAYNLYPAKMTGTLATETSSSIVTGNVMLLDDLYMALWSKSSAAEFTEETREIDGVSYAAEVYPASEYEPEEVFCFTEDGQLAYYIKGAPVIESLADIGVSTYTVRAIDTEVDPSVFDISGYEIK